ncbi:acyl-CoA dehydrogenase [Streptomyces sp. NPDC000927]|uniref:acyl-CoA dehydrogenase n=1 Tax=Streptomyces sp. NPDC000927 TaxID=3154371 RepID=UPI00332A8797
MTTRGRTTPVTRRIAELERLLGDPRDPRNPLGHSAVIDADERGVPLAAGERVLRLFGLNAEFVPRHLGGRFDQVDELVQLMRGVFRRDGTLGLGYGASSFVAGLAVWAAGTPGQQRRAARILLAEERICAGVPELDPDEPAAARLSAAPSAGRLVLNGGGPLVGNAERAEAAVLLARTGHRTGTPTHSHLLVDLEHLPWDRAARDLRFTTAGLRGLSLGAIEFRDCPVPADSVLGEPDSAHETELRTCPIIDTALPGMAVGIADTQLRTAVAIVRERPDRDRSVATPHHARDILAGAFAELLVCDALTTVAARSPHLLPAESGVRSAAVRHLVPRLLRGVSHRLSSLLGVDGCPEEGLHAVFRKAARDLLGITLAPMATRATGPARIVPRLPVLAEHAWLPALERPAAPPGDRDDVLTRLLSPGRPLPRLDFARLGTVTGAADGLTGVLPAIHHALARQPATAPELLALTGPLTAELRRLAGLARSLPPSGPGQVHDHGYEYRTGAPATDRRAHVLADRWTHLLAAAACLGLWRTAWQVPQPGFTADPVWVTAALHRLADRLGLGPSPLSARVRHRLHGELVHRCEDHLGLDLTGGPLAGTRTSDPGTRVPGPGSRTCGDPTRTSDRTRAPAGTRGSRAAGMPAGRCRSGEPPAPHGNGATRP